MQCLLWECWLRSIGMVKRSCIEGRMAAVRFAVGVTDELQMEVGLHPGLDLVHSCLPWWWIGWQMMLKSSRQEPKWFFQMTFWSVAQVGSRWKSLETWRYVKLRWITGVSSYFPSMVTLLSSVLSVKLVNCLHHLLKADICIYPTLFLNRVNLIHILSIFSSLSDGLNFSAQHAYLRYHIQR